MKTIGSRAEVWHGTAKKTSGGLLKKDLKKNKRGKIVSKKMSNRAKKEKRLEKAGYKTKKGIFKKFTSKKKKGGENTDSTQASMSRIERLEASIKATGEELEKLAAEHQNAWKRGSTETQEIYKKYRALKHTFDYLLRQYKTESNRKKKEIMSIIMSDTSSANRLNNEQIRFLSNTINKNLEREEGKTRVESPLHVRELLAKSNLVPEILKREKNKKRGEVRNKKKVINRIKRNRGI